MQINGTAEAAPRRKARVRLSLAEKMRRAQMLAQVRDRWVLGDLMGECVLAYHVADPASPNKLYQIILSRDPIYAGLYEVTSYELRYRPDPKENRMIHLVTRRYDKVAGFREPHLPHSFPDFDAFCRYLVEERRLISAEALAQALPFVGQPARWEGIPRIRLADG